MIPLEHDLDVFLIRTSVRANVERLKKLDKKQPQPLHKNNNTRTVRLSAVFYKTVISFKCRIHIMGNDLAGERGNNVDLRIFFHSYTVDQNNKQKNFKK